MISFLSSDAINHYTKVFMNFPFYFVHNLLPLNLKFLPESYVIEENKEIIGMVTVSPSAGNPYKLNISRLFLEQDYFNAGKQLIDFVISKYGAKGASTFVAKIDDSYDELLSLFAEGCGFRQCSSEQLWKMDTIRFTKPKILFSDRLEILTHKQSQCFLMTLLSLILSTQSPEQNKNIMNRFFKDSQTNLSSNT